MQRLTLRDPKQGWLNFAALFYSLFCDVSGLLLLLSYQSNVLLFPLLGILLSAHGRIVASYLVHEAAHANIFLEPRWNRWFGTASLWLAGCPYADFGHVKWMHMSHHNDRADTHEFDYRTFVKGNPWIKQVVLSLEYAFVPAVETIMHTRTALYPLLVYFGGTQSPIVTSTTRNQSSMIGTTVLLLFYYSLPVKVLLLHLISGACVLQFLAFNDAFHHTYDSIPMAQYTPGPGNRTVEYEHVNTYSNLVSTQHLLFNLLSLNFGYHNAHHAKAMTPWYELPRAHEALYGNPSEYDKDDNNSSRKDAQILPFRELWNAYCKHRLQRVLDDDYGVVGPPGSPGRADRFVGALGVSFLRYRYRSSSALAK